MVALDTDRSLCRNDDISASAEGKYSMDLNITYPITFEFEENRTGGSQITMKGADDLPLLKGREAGIGLKEGTTHAQAEELLRLLQRYAQGISVLHG